MVKKFFRNPLSKVRAQRRAVLTDITSGGEEASRDQVLEPIRAVVGTEVYIPPRDADYQLVDPDVLHAFLRGDGTDAYHYEKEGGDCDDFTDILVGRVREATMLASGGRSVAIGRVYALEFVLEEDGNVKKTGHHAMALAVLNDRSVVLVEPQNDRTYPLTKESSVYFVDI